MPYAAKTSTPLHASRSYTANTSFGQPCARRRREAGASNEDVSERGRGREGGRDDDADIGIKVSRWLGSPASSGRPDARDRRDATRRDERTRLRARRLERELYRVRPRRELAAGPARLRGLRRPGLVPSRQRPSLAVHDRPLAPHGSPARALFESGRARDLADDDDLRGVAVVRGARSADDGAGGAARALGRRGRARRGRRRRGHRARRSLRRAAVGNDLFLPGSFHRLKSAFCARFSPVPGFNT
eukprot:31193-Pelagococcus_subviridis.AAC.4